MKRLTQVHAALTFMGLLALTSTAHSALIRVSQESAAGAGDFDANVLGFIDPYASALTATQYYNYNNVFFASFDDGGQDVTLTSNQSHIFFVDGADGLSMFFVHDKPNDGTGGNADMTVTLGNETAAVLVLDDGPPNGTETVTVSGGGTMFQSDHVWIDCCTDGFVIGFFEQPWEAFVSFDLISGLSTWAAFDNGTNLNLSTALGRRVRFDMQVPEPGTFALLSVGLLVLGFTMRSRA